MLGMRIQGRNSRGALAGCDWRVAGGAVSLYPVVVWRQEKISSVVLKEIGNVTSTGIREVRRSEAIPHLI